MKKVNRLISLLLTIAMMLAISLPVSALTEVLKNPGSILIKDNDSVTASQKTFEAYNVLELKAYEDESSNIVMYEYTVPSSLADFYANRYSLDKTAEDFHMKVRDGIDAEKDLYSFVRDVAAASTDAAYTGDPVENGYLIKDLPFGYYALIDCSANGKPASAVIIDTATPNVEIVVKDEKPSSGETEAVIETRTTTLEIINIDEKGNRLPGAEFSITGKTYSSTVETDAEGVVRFTGLSEGTYSIVQTKAPEGYPAFTKTLDFIVTWDSDQDIFTYQGAMDNKGIAQLTIVNQKGAELPTTGGNGNGVGFWLSVKDPEGNPLEGAVFNVLGGDVNLTVTSDQTGRVFLQNLLPGVYILQQLSAPEGYSIENRKIDFSIRYDKNTMQYLIESSDYDANLGGFTLINQKSDVQTSEESSANSTNTLLVIVLVAVVLLILVIIILGVCIVLYISRNKKTNSGGHR